MFCWTKSAIAARSRRYTTNCHAVERRAEFGKRAINAKRVLGGRLDPNVKIFGKTRAIVKGECESADDQVSNAVGVERAQQISEVAVYVHRFRATGSPPRITPRSSPSDRQLCSAKIRHRTNGRSAKPASPSFGPALGGPVFARSRHPGARFLARYEFQRNSGRIIGCGCGGGIGSVVGSAAVKPGSAQR